MINLRFQVDAPWNFEIFRNLGTLQGRITKNKSWEIEHTYYSDALVDLDFSITRKVDHAGINFVVGILGYAIGARIYDRRHWDEEHDCWAGVLSIFLERKKNDQ